MRNGRPLSCVFLQLIAVLLSTCAYGECLNDFRSNKSGGVVISDVAISGTQTISSKLLGDMTSTLVGACFDDNSEELGERLKALFQDRGYFAVDVKNLKIKSGDPLSMPKPITLEAEVSEGQRYRLQETRVTGNHAFSAEQILSQFSLHKGDVFERRKLKAGLVSLRELYNPQGYLEMFFVPTTLMSDTSIILTIEITEGPQYHMGELQVFAEKETASKLRANWQLAEGTVFDPSYVSKYISDNRSILPSSFIPESIQVVTDCPRADATVRILVNALDPKAQTPAKNVPCDSQK